MKKLSFLLLSVSLSFCVQLYAQTSVWDGISSDKSWYDESKNEFHLQTASQLKGLADLTNIDKLTFENKTLYLDCDIDLSGFLWTPISDGVMTSDTPFKGSFDGQNHSITNICVSSDTNPYNNSMVGIRSYYCVGFFGVTQSAVIKNLIIQGEVITKENQYCRNIGLLTGYASKTSFIFIDADVKMEIGYNTANNIEIGGVAGSAYESTFYRIKSIGTINTLKGQGGIASSQIKKCGGICGSAASISECEVDVDMKIYTQGSGNTVYIGGCCGTGNVTDAIFTGNIEVYDSWKQDLKLWVGGITSSGSVENVVSAPSTFYAESTKPQMCVGIIMPKLSSGSVTNARYLGGVIPNPGDKGTSISEQELKSGSPIEGFGSDKWTYISGEYPHLKSFFKEKYKMIYIVDGVVFDEFEFEYGEPINTWVSTPWREGYTFSGWSEIPTKMPAKDVTVTGSFTINKYKLTYKVDDEEYESRDVEYGEIIIAKAEPVKEGYTFSGWSEVPATMPAQDVIVTGSFTINKYKLIYKVDDEEYKTLVVDYGSTITEEPMPTKEGYTFSGWSEIPTTMPAKDVIVLGCFTLVDAIEETDADVTEYRIYTLTGKQIDTLQKGINIILEKGGNKRVIYNNK